MRVGANWSPPGSSSTCDTLLTRSSPTPLPSQAARKTWGVKGGDAAALAAHRRRQLRRWEARAQGHIPDDDTSDVAETSMGDIGRAVLASFGLVAVVALRSRVRF